MNVGPVEGAWISGIVLTRRLTGTTILVLDAVGAEMVMLPVQVPAVKPDVFTCTLRVLGVAPPF